MDIKKCFSKQTGFTMTELLVVMAIISILTTAVLISYRNSNRNYSLDQATHQLVSNLRKIQNMALSGVETSGYDSYGLYVLDNTNSYILYIDTNNNNTYQPSDTIFETINLQNNIVVDSTTPLSNKLDIFFKSPDPITYINGSNSIGVLGTIVLNVDGLSKTKTITVNTAGLIQGN